MHHPDPFASDKPLFTITAQNYKDYAAKLTVGQIALFEKYPDYKMIVFPTRRSASFPKRTYDMTIKNAPTSAPPGGLATGAATKASAKP